MPRVRDKCAKWELYTWLYKERVLRKFLRIIHKIPISLSSAKVDELCDADTVNRMYQEPQRTRDKLKAKAHKDWIANVDTLLKLQSDTCTDGITEWEVTPVIFHMFLHLWTTSYFFGVLQNKVQQSTCLRVQQVDSVSKHERHKNKANNRNEITKLTCSLLTMNKIIELERINYYICCHVKSSILTETQRQRSFSRYLNKSAKWQSGATRRKHAAMSKTNSTFFSQNHLYLPLISIDSFRWWRVIADPNNQLCCQHTHIRHACVWDLCC